LFKQKWEFELADCLRITLAGKSINKALEVGCSNGRWLRWCSDSLGCKCYGLDSDPTGFDGSDIDFNLGDVRSMSYPNETFDFVFSLGLLEHFKYDERAQILAEQVRVLKRRGFLLCQIPNLFISLEYLFVKYFYDYRQGYKHNIVRPGEVRRLLKRLGCSLLISRFTGSFFERFARELQFGRLTRTEYLIVVQRD
jgi:SAM-dependent methyltransferase